MTSRPLGSTRWDGVWCATFCAPSGNGELPYFLNSHLLSEIEITCDEVVFIREGEVVTSRNLRATDETKLDVLIRARNLKRNAIDGLAAWGAVALTEDDRLTLTVPTREVLPDILRHLVGAGADVYEFTPHPMSLEELFVSIMDQDSGR